MSSHNKLAVGLQDMTRAGLIRMIEQLVRGKRADGDAEQHAEEAAKKSALHEEHTGKGNAPAVGDDDMPPPNKSDEQKPSKKKPYEDDSDEDHE